MDQVVEVAVGRLEARLERLEKEHNRVPLRGVVSAGGILDCFETVHVLPAIPTRKTIVFWEGDPVPSAKDTFWWAGPEDVRWHPIGGKFVDINGDPGDVS